MPDALTLLTAAHGFDVSGAGTDLNTDSYLALIPAFQRVLFADGRAWTNNIATTGFHRLDFINTRVVGTVTGTFRKGEVVNQAVSLAQGIFSETIGTGANAIHLIYRTTETEFVVAQVITGADSGATVTPTAVSAIQTLTPSLTATSGSFTLTYEGQTTAAIAYNASTAAIKTALELLSTVTVGDITPGGTIFSAGTGGLTLTFAATLGRVQLVSITSSLVGAGSTAITVAVVQTTPGDLGIIAPPHWLAWDTAPSLLGYDFEGTADSANATGLVDASLITQYPVANYINNWYAYIVSGTGAGSYAQITAYNNSTGGITVADWLDEDGAGGGTNPAADSGYGISQTPVETTGGIFPDGGSNIGCLCFGRIFLNSMLNPHQWFCSRVNEPNDWDTGQDDVASATNSQNSKAGEVGDVITAMISYKDHYLIWGCLNEIWVLRSDPLQGGVNTNLSKTTGIFSPTSYCWDDQNNLYFLGTDGIYKLTANGIISGAPPENMTKARLPKLVTSLALNRKTDRVTMAFDKQRYGIEISITQLDGTWGVCFWYDIRTEGIFPDVFPTGTVTPSCLYYYDATTASERKLLIGGYDGYLREFDETVKNDDGTAIESYFAIGAFVSDIETRSKGTINEVTVTPGKDTDGIVVDLHRAETADDLINNIEALSTPAATKTFTGDQPGTIRDKVSGRAIAIMIENSTLDESFSIDSIDIALKTSGKQR